MTATYLLPPGNLLWEILEKYGHEPMLATPSEAGSRNRFSFQSLALR